jgi:hypothetical protein
MMPEPLQQVCVSLPPNLIELVLRHASVTDRTLGGMIRHVVSEWARSHPSPTGAPVFPVGPTIPGFSQTPEGIAQAKEYIAKLREELRRIRHRQKIHADDASDEDRAARINFELDVVSKGIDMATRMPPSNGEP